MTAVALPATLEIDPSIGQLLLRAQSGDRASEARLCARFVPAIRTFARRRLRGDDAVAEFVQDALLLFVEAVRRGAVHDAERVGGFILGICRNLSRDRAKQRDRRAQLWELYGADLAPFAPEEPQYASYETMHLEDCVSQLSKRARDVLRLSYAEAKSHGEIAAELSTSEANARVMRHRTLEALRECLSKRISWEEAGR